MPVFAEPCSKAGAPANGAPAKKGKRSRAFLLKLMSCALKEVDAEREAEREAAVPDNVAAVQRIATAATADAITAAVATIAANLAAAAAAAAEALLERKRRQITSFPPSPVKPMSGLCPMDAPWAPPRIVDDFVSAAERQHILSKAHRLFKASALTGGVVDKSYRHSQTAFLQAGGDAVVRAVVERGCKAANFPPDHAASLQVVRYDPSSFFKPHYDTSESESEDESGRRAATVVIYLSDGFTGGETRFPVLGKAFKPEIDAAVVFHTLQDQEKEQEQEQAQSKEKSKHKDKDKGKDKDKETEKPGVVEAPDRPKPKLNSKSKSNGKGKGKASKQQQIHPLSLHEGAPVLAGCKYIATIWVHERRCSV